MGWSMPEVPEKDQAPAWSPWVCLLIIVLGLFIGLIVAVLTSPTTGLPSLSSGYWLSLTAWTFTGISAAVTVYSFWWETLATRVWNWNEWRRNMRLMWRIRAHQHFVILHHVFISADMGLLPRIAHTEEGGTSEVPPLTLLPEEPLTPGISRFEQLSRHLISRIKPTLLQRYPSGPMQVIVQTGGNDKDRESQSFHRLWKAGSLPWKVEIDFQDVGSSFGDWNRLVGSSRHPILVLAMHYRQPDDELPEFACALFLMPPALLNPGEQKNALRLFRAMPLNTHALTAELGELRDMAQQPAGKKLLVWHCGLADAPRQSVSRVLNELSLPLYDGVGMGGVIDFDTACARYGGLAGWALIAAAADMAVCGPASQWLLLESEHEAWAVTLANAAPVTGQDSLVISPPFPGGSILVALLLNTGLYGLMIRYFPAVSFSWLGVLLLLMSLGVTLPGIAFVLRRAIARFQRPSFIKAARQSGKE
ncbi:hypothetical protein GIX45_28475 [Erwinia sp. CPCC 100877]|nr:hypothetical protein [Erwinia sp. CPCC 100877]